MQAPTLLETLIPIPRWREVDHVDLAAPASRVWNALREGHVHFPFWIRALLRARSHGAGPKTSRVETGISIANSCAAAEQPGFHIMGEEAGREFTVGAIAAMGVFKFEFLPGGDSHVFQQFSEPGFIKMAWRMSVRPLGTYSSRLHIELRLDATDPLSWRRFRRGYIFLRPVMHLLRRRVLASFADHFGAPELLAHHRRAGVQAWHRPRHRPAEAEPVAPLVRSAAPNRR